jgi:DNA-binding response OmpR family regulator
MHMSQHTKILVVEDEPTILKVTRLTLASAGYEVSEATTGAECLRLAETQPPDLVLLDRVLPDLDGAEVCRRLKTNPATAHIFVALLSALKTSGDDQADGLEIGADG